MLFNSIEFLVFLLIVFVIYWFIVNKDLSLQNIFLLLASYVFYGWWDWRFLFLLLGMAASNYLIGIKIDSAEAERKRRNWLILGLVVNIGTLCTFKYFNFFIDSFIDFISLFGYDLPRSSTRIVLPIGISFYTFLS
jgi:D-alanyl-lipoteichoic acid acyltransferase DltB (MBOAT superfamily)